MEEGTNKWIHPPTIKVWKPKSSLSSYMASAIHLSPLFTCKGWSFLHILFPVLTRFFGNAHWYPIDRLEKVSEMDWCPHTYKTTWNSWKECWRFDAYIQSWAKWYCFTSFICLCCMCREKYPHYVKHHPLLCFLHQRDIALWGHTTDAGHFQSRAEFWAETDKVLQHHLKSAPHNAKYHLPEVQNDLVSVVAISFARSW